jgi:hypothetical protein
MTTHATLETRPQTLTSLVLRIIRRLRCGAGYQLWFLSWLHLYILGSSVVMFAATEHLVSASGTAAVASEIGSAAFASASAFDSSVVA